MEYIFLSIVFILGLAIGSFLNVLIDRLAKGQKITGRSHCDHCRRKLTYRDLIPVVSFFLLKGKCRYCQKKISWFYPLVELLTGVFFVLIIQWQNFKPYQFFSFYHFLLTISYLGITSCLIVIFFQDLKYRIISDWIQLFFFFFVLISHLLSFSIDLEKFLINQFFSGIIVMLPILFLHLITAGRGMGFGDVKLSFTIGFFLGIKKGFLALYFAFIIGGIIGLILILFKKKKLKSKIAFGPFLVTGLILVLSLRRWIILI